MEATMTTKEVIIYMTNKLFSDDSDYEQDAEAIDEMVGLIIGLRNRIIESQYEEAA
jgi:hypothetical protein